MTYEEQNKALKKKLILIDKEITQIEDLIKELPYFTSDAIVSYHRNNAELSLLVLKERKKDIEDALKESPKKRKISTLLGTIANNLPEPPKKVYQSNGLTKSMYSISNGCFMWLAVYVAIGFVIIMLILN